MRPWTLVPVGDRAVTVDLPDVAADALRDVIRALDLRVRGDAPVGVTALVPAIRSLTLHYDPTRIDYGALSDYVAAAMATLVVTATEPRTPIAIPVCYGGEFGPDLDDVARAHDTTADAIVAEHTSRDYVVAMIGFLPGFPYLEGLSAALHTPRRDTPRTNVPAGSVGIGGASTGIYPFASPGGWHVIGRTPHTLFDPQRTQASLLAAGDRVRFMQISPSEWREHGDLSRSAIS